VILPPVFWAPADVANDPTANAVTRKIRASAQEAVAAFIEMLLQVPIVRFFRIVSFVPDWPESEQPARPLSTPFYRSDLAKNAAISS
jgi:hypothetical protein